MERCLEPVLFGTNPLDPDIADPATLRIPLRDSNANCSWKFWACTGTNPEQICPENLWVLKPKFPGRRQIQNPNRANRRITFTVPQKLVLRFRLSSLCLCSSKRCKNKNHDRLLGGLLERDQESKARSRREKRRTLLYDTLRA